MLRVVADGLQDGWRSGSIYHQGRALHHFAEVAIDDGCRYGLVCGDVTHGTKRMYRGIEMDLHAYGADEQKVTRKGTPRA